MIRRLALALWTAPALLLAAAPVAAQTDRPELVDVRFDGNDVVPDGVLESIIQNRETTCRAWVFTPVCWVSDGLRERRYLYPRQIDTDSLRIVTYYRTIGYREVTVDTALVERDGGVRLSFGVREGRPVVIDSVDYTVYDEPEVRDLLANLPLRTGDPFSLRLIEEVRDTLTRRLYESGYAYAEVFRSSFIPVDDPYSARVSFEVDPGPRVRFGDVSIEGNAELDTAVIARTLPFRPGQLYRPRLLEEGQRNVVSLDMVRNATVQGAGFALQNFDTIVPVEVEIAEGDKHRVRTGAGWSTADCFNTEARWASRNFFGGARRLTLSGGVSNILAPQLNSTACQDSGRNEFARLNGRLGAELVQPSLFSSRNSLTAGAYVERESQKDIFVREAIGLSIGVTRQISRRTTGTFSWQPQLTRLDADEFFCQGFLICTEEDIAVFRSANWLAPIGTNLVIDRSNGVLNPTAGWLLALDLEHASRFTGSDFAYNRIAGELATYFELGAGVVLGLRARGGAVSQGEFFRLADDAGTGVIHPQKRFYAGGANTVRGYGENRLGPSILSVPIERLLETPAEGAAACTPEQLFAGSCDPASLDQDVFSPRPIGGSRMAGANVEFRIPIGSTPIQVALFADAGQVWGTDESARLADLEITPGFGLRYFSPIGPIRVDLGYRSGGRVPTRVITSGLRPWDPMTDDPGDRLLVDGRRIDWVGVSDLRILDRSYLFDAGSSFQLHFSIGQAF